MLKVSAVIPVYNEENDIEKCVESLLAQSFPVSEIIVVDDGSTDSTLKVVKSYSKILVLTQNHKGPGAARNLGAKKAKGDILLFVDADMTFDKDYVKNLIAPLIKDKRVMGTTHDYEIVTNTKNAWSKCWGKVRVSPKNAHKIKIFRAIRRKNFLELGGFDPRYGYADDQTIWFKHNIAPVVARNTKCFHRNPSTLKAVFLQSRWIGASIEQINKIPKRVRYLVVWVLIGISPLLVPIVAIKTIARSFNPKVIIASIPFSMARVYGTINGMVRKIYLDINYR